MTDTEAYLELQILNASPTHDVSFFAPSLQVQAFHRGRLLCNLKLGEDRVFFDLASLTKILFTNTVLMKLVQGHKLDLRVNLKRWLKDWPDLRLTAQHLLTHRSGLEWWRPFYEVFQSPRIEQDRWRELEQLLKKESLQLKARRLTSSSVYSDLGYLLLGQLMIVINREPLSQIWTQEVAKKLSGGLHFLPHLSKKDLYAPTGFCKFRQRSLQAEVHDTNAWALGGVSTHAGLFGRIDDVSEWGLKLRSVYYGGREALFSQPILKAFTRRTVARSVGDWGLGFMKPTQGAASCGPRFHTSSFGHLGFTGTSFWMDPNRDLFVVVLSNRTFNGETQNIFKDLRPWIHSWLVEALR